MTEQNPVSNDTSARTWTPSILWSFDTPVIAVSAYQSGDISLAKAAELLGMHALALRASFVKLGIPLKIGPGTLEEAKAEVEAIRVWRSEATE